jgi:23S rRNA pseudouridine2457 synthase
MSDIILFNKPWGVLSQFTDDEGRPTLADYVDAPGFRPAGRLDRDSEGLLLLCADGALQARIASPRHKLPKTYLVQVEGDVTPEALQRLARGVRLNDGPTRAARARRIDEPALWPREPPVRFRATIPTSWIELTLTEGRNRQVRRMTAAVGFPTLRLVRWRIGPWTLEGIPPGGQRRLAVRSPRDARL